MLFYLMINKIGYSSVFDDGIYHIITWLNYWTIFITKYNIKNNYCILCMKVNLSNSIFFFSLDMGISESSFRNCVEAISGFNFKYFVKAMQEADVRRIENR